MLLGQLFGIYVFWVCGDVLWSLRQNGFLLTGFSKIRKSSVNKWFSGSVVGRVFERTVFVNS